MTLYITLQLADGRHETAVSSLDDFVGDYTLCGIDISIRETDCDAEFSIVISADWSALIDRFMISADLGGKDVKIFDAGTDSSSCTKPITGENPIIIRNIFMSEGTKGIINLAFSSYNRYYTYFDYKDGYVSAVIDLENKAIKAGEKYTLETVMIDDSICAQTFFDTFSYNVSFASCARIRSGAYYGEPALRVNVCEYINNPEDPSLIRKSRLAFINLFPTAGTGPILLTHLTELLYSFHNPSSRLKQRDYSVSLFRRCLKVIRECAGRNVLLADSDSPICECIGLIDGIYTGNPSSLRYVEEDYNYFGYLSDLASNLARKASYHGICFANKGKLYGDLISKDNFTSEERKMWHLASTFNGARPYDFWEENHVSHTFIQMKGNSVRTEFHLFYNWKDEPCDFQVKALEQSAFIDCFEKKILKSTGTFYDFVLPPHTARGILVKQLPRRSALLFAESDLYLGAGSVYDIYFGQSLKIYSNRLKSNIRFYMPYGSEDDIYLNDELIDTSRLDFDVIDGGKVFFLLSKF